MIELLYDPSVWASFIALVVMEIVLGIDNIVFISIQTDKLPKDQQKLGRTLGLGLALLTRIILLLSISWVLTLTEPLFNLADVLGISGVWHERLALSGRDLILLSGGVFLLYKSIHEIHENVEGIKEKKAESKPMTLTQIVIQIGLLDIVFSLDSVITAVGMADHVEVMIAAVVVAMIVMMFTIDTVSNFINQHPSVKLLALAFLLLIGISLIMESLDQPIEKGYIYFAMAFAIFLEYLNLEMKKNNE